MLFDPICQRYEVHRDCVKTRDTIYWFSCAQSADQAQKAKVSKSNSQVTYRMDRFEYDSWLYIAALKQTITTDVTL